MKDSIYANAPAVNIAIYITCVSERESVGELGRYVAPASMMLGQTNVETIFRRMVKINDASALDDLSEFTFDPDVYQDIESGIPAFVVDNAFGARIFKPDGRVIDVDMKQTLTDTEGKKGKEEVKHKIAIPGLEVGDVLEYFYLRNNYFLGNLGMQRQWNVFSSYPTASYVIETLLDPKLTTEFRTYNGIKPVETLGITDAGKEHYRWEFYDLPAMETPKYCSVARQYPFIGVRVSDNISRLYSVNDSRRNPGVYMNLVTPVYLAEVAELMSKINIDGKDMSLASNILKNYRASHTGLTEDEIADAAWLAVLYSSLLSEKMYKPMEVISFFKDLLDKQDLQTVASLGVTTSRNDVDVDMILDTSDLTPLVMFGNRIFINHSNTSFAPGEVPSSFAGEKFYILEGSRSKVFKNQKFYLANIPKAKVSEHSRIMDVKVAVPDVDGTELKVDYKGELKGSFKNVGALLTNPDELASFCEEYLEIPDKMKQQRKYDVAKLSDFRKNVLESLPRINFGLETVKVDTAICMSNGCSPKNNVLAYNISFKTDGLLTPAGDDLILNIGALAGNMGTNKDYKADRQMSIFADGPDNTRVNLSLAIPEGYYVDESDLETLKCNVGNLCGNFYVNAALNKDAGTVDFQINYRNKSAVYSPDKWKDFVDLKKTAADYASTTLILHRIEE